MNKRAWLIVIFLLTLALIPACTARRISQPHEIIFMEGYKPQANLPFVGVYVAQEKGFFEDENLKVTIQPSPGSGQHLQLTVAGKVHVTTQDAAVLLKRRADPGLPLVAFALIGQTGQQAFAALESSGMQTPADWKGHVLGYKGTISPDLSAMLAMNGVSEQEVEIVNVGFDPRVLSEGKVDLYPVFKSNEPYLLRQWGFPVALWDPANFGIPTLGLTYVTSDETLAQRPDDLTAFLRAAIRGIRYAQANPDEAVEIVMKHAGPQTDAAHMRFMLDTELAELETDLTRLHGIGWQTETQWQTLADFLVKYDAMKSINVDDVFTTAILEKAQ